MKPPSNLPAAPGGRSCANCACYLRMSPVDGVCTRATPEMTKVRVEVPRLGRDGTPDRDRAGRPIMVPGEQIGFKYPQVQSGMWCFDGWRGIGAYPGEREADRKQRAIAAVFAPAIEAATDEGAEPATVLPLVRAAFLRAVAIYTASADPAPSEAANDDPAAEKPAVIQ